MALNLGDMQSVATAGWWLSTSSTVAEPSLAVVNDGTGTSVTATISDAAGVTNTLWYRAYGATTWTEGGSRSGNGTIPQAGLTANQEYWFIAISTSAGFYSRPSEPVCVFVTAGRTRTYEILAVIEQDQAGEEVTLLCTEMPA